MNKIKELAKKIAKSDQYISEEYAERVLTEVLEALKEGRYYTSVVSVAKSGMSRVIKIAYVKDDELNKAPHFVYKLAGTNNAHRISGCGMDMLFAAQYNLWCALTDEPYQKMPSYKEL